MSINMRIEAHLTGLVSLTQQLSRGEFTSNVDAKISKLASRISSADPANAQKIEKSLSKLIQASSNSKTTEHIRNVQEQWKIGLALGSIERQTLDDNTKALLPTALHASSFKDEEYQTEQLFQRTAQNSPDELFVANDFGKTPMDYALETGRYGALINVMAENVPLPAQDLAKALLTILTDDNPQTAEDRDVLGQWIHSVIETTIEADPHSEGANDLRALQNLEPHFQTLQNPGASIGLKYRAIKELESAPLSSKSAKQVEKSLDAHHADTIAKGRSFDSHAPKMDLAEFASLSFVHGNYLDLFEVLHDHFEKNPIPESVQRQALLAFVLDKVHDPELLAEINKGAIPSGIPQIALLAEALTLTCGHCIAHPDSPIGHELAEQKPFITQLMQSFNWYTLIAYAPDHTQVAHDIVDFISKDQPSFPLWMPAGTKTHALGVSVEPNGDGTARVSLHNTGNGVTKYHPRQEDTHRSQTTISYDVPISQLQDPVKWQKLLDSHKQESVDHTYELFFDLVSGCEQIEIVNPLVAFESIQVNGSCASQHAMAFLRHVCLQNMQGSEMHRFGCYKHLKNTLLCFLTGQHKEVVDGPMRERLDAKYELHLADREFANQAKPEDENTAAENYFLARIDAKYNLEANGFSQLWHADTKALVDDYKNYFNKCFAEMAPEEFVISWLNAAAVSPVREEILVHVLKNIDGLDQQQQAIYKQLMVDVLMDSKFTEHNFKAFMHDLDNIDRVDDFTPYL